MTKIELYETAVATGKALVAETDNIKLSLGIAQAATDNKVAGSDFPIFQQFVNQTRTLYAGMARQKLPSEIAAAVKASAPVTNTTVQE